MSQAHQFLILTTAGWRNRQQEDPIEYLREENRALREQLGRKRTVRSIKEECLSRVVVLGERPLRLFVREYVEH